jgi:hypothetical protein
LISLYQEADEEDSNSDGDDEEVLHTVIYLNNYTNTQTFAVAWSACYVIVENFVFFTCTFQCLMCRVTS